MKEKHMPLDLTVKPNDHPVSLLRDLMETLPENHADRIGIRRSIEVLESHEKAEGVTFLTGDNQTLVAIQKAYDKVGSDAVANAEFISETADLLGLGT